MLNTATDSLAGYFKNFKGLTLLFPGILFVLVGYYLIYSISADSALEEVIRNTRLGIILTFLGSASLMIYIFRRSR